VSEQTAIEIPDQPALPELPPPPDYWPSTVSKYSRVKLQRRDLCTVCVRLAHAGAQLPTGPQRATHRRKGLPTDKADKQLDLCRTHHRQYLNRDNDARVKAGLDPLPGGG
jgi:hypothetical protein